MFPPPPSSPRYAITAIRLVYADQPNSWFGRLEVQLSNGQWGTVCENNWDTNQFNAQAVCRQLGLPWMGAVAKSNAFLGSNPALPILLDDVACGGGESTLDACDRRMDGSKNCDHSKDVGELTVMGPFPLMSIGR